MRVKGPEKHNITPLDLVPPADLLVCTGENIQELSRLLYEFLFYHLD